MRRDTRQRKNTLAGLRTVSDTEQLLGMMVRVISAGKQALDAVMLERGRTRMDRCLLVTRRSR